MRRFEELCVPHALGGPVSGRIAQASVEAVKRARRHRRARRAPHGAARRGAEWTGRCPFHDERTPSFWVNPRQEGLLLLRLPGAGRRASTSCARREALDFTDAVEWLAERYGVELEYEEARARGRSAAARRGPAARAARADRGASTRACCARARGRGRARLPGRARHRRRDGASASSSASRPTSGPRHRGARSAGFAEQELDDAGHRAARPARRACRPLPRPADLPPPRRAAAASSPSARRAPAARRGRAEVRQLARGPALAQGRRRSTACTSPARAIARADEAIVVEGYTDVIGLAQAGVRRTSWPRWARP